MFVKRRVLRISCRNEGNRTCLTRVLAAEQMAAVVAVALNIQKKMSLRNLADHGNRDEVSCSFSMSFVIDQMYAQTQLVYARDDGRDDASWTVPHQSNVSCVLSGGML